MMGIQKISQLKQQECQAARNQQYRAEAKNNIILSTFESDFIVMPKRISVYEKSPSTGCGWGSVIYFCSTAARLAAASLFSSFFLLFENRSSSLKMQPQYFCI